VICVAENSFVVTINGDTLKGKFLRAAGDTVDVREKLAMWRFGYSVNSNGVPNGNPTAAHDFYNYLTGLWKDNTHWTWAVSGYGGNPADSCIFMFTSYPWG